MAIPTLETRDNTYVIGDLGLALLLGSMIGLGFIGTFYQLFPQFSIPVVFTVVFGLFGLFLAFATGALQFKVNAIKMSVLLASIIALIFIVAFGAITTFIKPQSATGSILLLLPAAVSLLFFPSVAVLEEGQWRGIYMALRKLFPGIPFWLIGLGISLGGMAYHQAVAFNLFRGTIFSEPGYFLWIGGSWFFYCLILEFTKNFSASALTHWIWNFVITFQNLRLLGGS